MGFRVVENDLYIEVFDSGPGVPGANGQRSTIGNYSGSFSLGSHLYFLGLRSLHANTARISVQPMGLGVAFEARPVVFDLATTYFVPGYDANSTAQPPGILVFE